MPVDLLAKPVLGFSALGAIACFIAAGSLMLSLPFRLEEAMGYAPQEVGHAAAAVPADDAGGGAARRVDERPHRADQARRYRDGASRSPGCCCWRSCPTHPGETAIAWRLALTALGFGLFFAPNSRLLIGQAPRERAAAAGGLLSTSRLLGQTLAAVTVGILLAGGAGLGPHPLFVACALAVVAALCSLARFRSVTRAGGTMATLRQPT